MKEHIDTIPVIEAYDSGDECPFCYLERMAKQRTIRYVLGPEATYMEPDVRAQTAREGFCREHFQNLYDYGNSLGNALIMQSYYDAMLRQLKLEVEALEMPDKRPLLGKPKNQKELPIVTWAREQQGSCFICNRLDYHMGRYYTTFFALVKDPEFREKVEQGKGCCMRHFIQLMEKAREELPNSQREWFYETVPTVMLKNMIRVKEDLDWFVGMFDYRSAGRDWKNSRDAVSRGMQKLQGLHPSDPPYKQDP